MISLSDIVKNEGLVIVKISTTEDIGKYAGLLREAFIKAGRSKPLVFACYDRENRYVGALDIFEEVAKEKIGAFGIYKN